MRSGVYFQKLNLKTNTMSKAGGEYWGWETNLNVIIKTMYKLRNVFRKEVTAGRF